MAESKTRRRDVNREKKLSETEPQPEKSTKREDKYTESAVRIIAINEEGTKFTLDENVLQTVLDATEKINSKKVIILSVVGAFRTGKSFLLDLFLRYLRYVEIHGKAPELMDSKEQIPVWVKSGGTHLVEGKAEGADSAPGFLWRGGQDRTTTGIWMYNKPFVYTPPGTSEKIPIILMDTQGMFDFQTTKELTAAIFGLSTLISSFEIYNLAKQIQEDHLQQLHYFTEFSRVALKEWEAAQDLEHKITKQSKTTTPGEKKSPFQRLQFLVRDWQNFTEDENIKLCIEESARALEDAMKQNVDDSGTRAEIKAAFEDLDCFLLPHPGLKMTKKQYDGNVEQIEPTFYRLLDKYVHLVFDEKLVVKQINGREIGPHALGEYIKAYATVFRDGHLPKALTLVQAISFTTNICAKDEAFKIYKQTMDEKCGGNAFLSDEELSAVNSSAKDRAFGRFDKDATFGNQESILLTRRELEQMVIDEFSNYKKANKFKMQAGLERYIIPIIAAIAAFVFDSITDWTCDSWSESCRAFSRLMAIVYYIVFSVLGYEFYRVYRAQGTAAVGITAMGLGQATIQRVDEVRHAFASSVARQSDKEKERKRE